MLGRTRWAIAEGYIPEWSHGPEPEFVSHETACILNANDADAHVVITIYYSDREPAGPYRVTVPARRTQHLRFNDLSDFSKGARDALKFENVLREAYVDIKFRGPLSGFSLRAGRQQIIWGESDGFRMLDRVNNLDLSWHFQQELPPPGFGIGTALDVNLLILTVISSADATAGRLRTKRPRTARQVDALRIRFSLLC